MTHFRSTLEYTLISVAAWKFRWMPLGWARGFAGFFAWIASSVLGIRRQVALDNLRHAFPELPAREHRRIYRRCFRHFVRVGAEMARLPRMDDRFIAKWMDIPHPGALDEALAEGRGCIVVSGHLGNWEWMGGAMAKLGYPVTYVVTSQANPLVDRWFDAMRSSAGIEIVRRRDAVRGVLSALKRNRALAVLCDQDAGSAGVMAPFFGRDASTPRGPAAFHLRTGAPLVFASALVDARGRYTVRFERLEIPTDSNQTDRSASETELMRVVTRRLEEEIRKAPEQWLWLHRRWKTRLNE